MWQGVCIAGGMCGRRGGMHGREGVHGRGHAWQGSMHDRGWVCMAGGHAWWGVHGRGVCMVGGPLTCSQCVGGTHPTGMHSCL